VLFEAVLSVCTVCLSVCPHCLYSTSIRATGIKQTRQTQQTDHQARSNVDIRCRNITFTAVFTSTTPLTPSVNYCLYIHLSVHLFATTIHFFFMVLKNKAVRGVKRQHLRGLDLGNPSPFLLVLSSLPTTGKPGPRPALAPDGGHRIDNRIHPLPPPKTPRNPPYKQLTLSHLSTLHPAIP
jgi:hypothetical protein